MAGQSLLGACCRIVLALTAVTGAAAALVGCAQEDRTVVQADAAALATGDTQATESTGVARATGSALRPNIVLIVADDLGYSDLGILGSEIPTPNIDALATGGMMFTQFYANMACSQTRAMLMSGTDSHVAGLGTMARPNNPRQGGQPGYEGRLNYNVASLANLMKDAGYHTYMTGKWHLGNDVDTGPRARGFEESFISLDGAAHLGGLSWNGPGLAPYRDGDEMTTVGDDFYTTRFYTNRMIEYIEANRDDDAPFFAYLAYTAPHWPLQAPRESIEKFAGWYDDGYEALYERRLARSRELGLVPVDYEGQPLVDGQPRWDELSAEEQRMAARRMEIYAAMVSDLDTYIGQFLDYLDSVDELDNTLIMFISDNGPESTRRELSPPGSNWVAACCDNSYENLGNGDSYVMYGANWARASTVPFRRAKATAFEGGIHVPAFVRFPGVIEPGSRTDEVATVMDILPTFLELAGTEHPGSEYRGRPVAPVRGRSLVDVLLGAEGQVMPVADVIGWELYGHRSVRRGNWKLVWDARERDAAAWKLFNLAEDPGELNDLRDSQPEQFATMQAAWDEYAEQNGVILLQ